MSVSKSFADFHQYLSALRKRDGRVEVLPVQLSEACARVLGADGAGLSVISSVRVPLAWTSADARLVETAQVTLDQGPCLDAAMDGRFATAGPETMQRRWPRFAERVLASTPFTSVMSVPMMLDGALTGALDAYWSDPQAAERVSEETARMLSERVSQELLYRPWKSRRHRLPGPAWLDGDAPRQRMRVWTAAGMVSEALQLENIDAVSAMRQYAIGRSVTLDEIAALLISGDLSPSSLLDGRRGDSETDVQDR